MWKPFSLFCAIGVSLLACKSQRSSWPTEAPIPLDTAAIILAELYHKRAVISAEGLLTPTHDTLWHTHAKTVLDKYHISETTWDSLRQVLRRHPQAMTVLAESALARIGR